MLVRSRLSRIYYRRKFFDYPLKLAPQTLAQPGPRLHGADRRELRVVAHRAAATRIDARGFSLQSLRRPPVSHVLQGLHGKGLGRALRPRSPPNGAPSGSRDCRSSRAVIHALRRPFQNGGHAQKGVETSLIERFLYPRLGPGQMWEEVASQVRQRGGELHLNHRVVDIQRRGAQIESVKCPRPAVRLGPRRLPAITSSQPCRFAISPTSCAQTMRRPAVSPRHCPTGTS